MADVKISALGAISAVAGEDLVAIVDDPSGTPASRKATVTQLATFINASAVTGSSTTTFTNKTIDAEATGNAISNIDVLNLKSGVLDTDITSVSGSDDTIPSAKAVKTYVDAQIATEDTLSELNDTTITSVGDNEILQYNNSSSVWENQTLAEADIATATALASKAPIASPTFTGTVVLPNVPAVVTTQLNLKAPLNSPTLTTPNIGTPSDGVLTNCTGLPPAGVVGTSAILGANTFTADQTITEAGTAEIIRFRNQSLDGQFIAKDTYKNLSSTSVERIIAQNIMQTTDYTNGAEDGSQRMHVMENGTLTEYLNIQGAGAKIIAYKPLDMSGTDIDNVQNVIHDISATGLDVDFSEDQLQTYPTLTGNVTFTTFQNIVAGKSKTIRLLADSTDRECTFPSGIKWVGTAPTSNVHTVTASKYAIITFTSFGTTEAEIIGAFAVEE